MASVAPSAWASPPGTSVAAVSSSQSSPRQALVLPPKHPKGRRLGGALVVRASPAELPEETTSDGEPAVTDRVKLALAKAKAYREKSSAPTVEGDAGGGGVLPVAAFAADVEVARADVVGNRHVVPGENPSGKSSTPADAEKLVVKASVEFKANTVGVEDPGVASEESRNVDSAIPDSVKLALEKAREYKKNKGTLGDSGNVALKEPRNIGLIKNQQGSPENAVMERKVQKPGGLKVSSIDFVGLEFSEKKNRGTPAGLAPMVDNFFDGDLADVEIIVGDASKFESSAPSKLSSNEVNVDDGLYKPKVSTWGVFPRPSNISKTFGGGRNIRPGEVLESAEAKAAREEHTKQLIATYKNKLGLSIDAKLKAECEEALKVGDLLMDKGKLGEALPYYENIMEKLAFQNELHGIAALQWSICQDSLHRPDEARVMYERLQSHPSIKVSKKAKQFMFGFQAMEMMKVSSYSTSKTTGYEDYFDAFVEDKVKYAPTATEQDGGTLFQALPYMILLFSPVFFVLAIAIRKSLNS